MCVCSLFSVLLARTASYLLPGIQIWIWSSFLPPFENAKWEREKVSESEVWCKGLHSAVTEFHHWFTTDSTLILNCWVVCLSFCAQQFLSPLFKTPLEKLELSLKESHLPSFPQKLPWLQFDSTFSSCWSALASSPCWPPSMTGWSMKRLATLPLWNPWTTTSRSWR